ncbi:MULTISPECIES: hypothetical protein [Paraburkholderia]|uniref:hypothetical protein n=1 Tax=Paraburkholderia TaxID=1822464 RepID=UPI000AECDC75|nr:MULTISPECIES: hypothetical protein [Paraburkholderia]RKR43599.1 hypothetical protein B0G82_1172 [Paraburkholderia sp. BL17N1]TDY24856.1 hypothetical protein B0G81_5300 [Paraburkholderia sp. BL6665CI2N2]CAD6533505.1 hypothetical protein LMG28727_03080 [Paraburkholderia kirstenboschensis]
MSEQKVAGQSCTNDQTGSVADAKAQQVPLYFFYPETAELFECPVESIEPVANEIALMSKLSEDLIEARQQLGAAHANWLDQQGNVALRPQLEASLKAAIQKEEAATQAVHKELTDTPAFNKDGVWELMPLKKFKSGTEAYVGQRLTYVRSSKVANHFRRYKLDSDKPQLKSFLKKDPSTGKYELDHDKMNDKLNSALKKTKYHEWKTDPLGCDWTLQMTAAFNKNANFKSPDDPDAMSEFSGGAQMLRLFAGAGASAKVESTVKSFDDALHLRGEIAVSAKGKGEIGAVLADGNLQAKFFLPSKAGLQLWIPAPTQEASGAYSWAHTPDTDLGFFRLAATLKAGASCGASLLAEGGIEFKLGRDGKTQQVRGTRAKRDLAQMKTAKVDVTKVEDKTDAGGDLKAFVGVEAEASIEGAFQWRRPEEKRDKWTAFASIKPGASAQAGAGAQAAFHITYDGKFRILMKAGLCAGVGLKGDIEAVVDVVYMGEFVWWAKTQIAYAGDRNLKYFADTAFKTFCAMCTLAIVTGREIGNYVGQQERELMSALQEFVRTKPRQFIEAIHNANDALLNSLAEVKGYLVYALKAIGDEFEDLRLEAASAISRIIAAAQVKNEVKNVYQSTSPDFSQQGDAQFARAEIGRFIGMDQLAMLESQPRDAPAPGFRFAFNDTPRYAMQEGTNVAWLDPTRTAGTDTQIA